VTLAAPLRAQQTPAELLQAARAALDARQLERAGPLLTAALAAAATPRDSLESLFWTSVWHFLSGRDSLARAYARGVFALNPDVSFVGADGIAPSFVSLLEQERYAARNPNPVFTSSSVDVGPSRLSGPSVAYPPGAWRRQAKGRVLVQGIVDTTGRFEAGLEILEVPDSELVEPVRQAMMAYVFAPGRVKGRAVRTMTRIGIMLQPGPPPNPTELVRRARAQVAAGHGDSALALLDFADDSLVGATPGVRAFSRLVRGLALRSLGRDGAAAAALDDGLAAVATLTQRGVDLAPFLRHLADSIRRTRRAPAPLPARPAAGSAVGAPTALEAVDQQPALIRTPPIDYPAEMRSLRIGGTVIVETVIDSAGRPVAGTARVVQSPNPGLNAAALRAVAAAAYRPARRGGRPVGVTIRQPVTFSP
jgi:TonB family protein